MNMNSENEIMAENEINLYDYWKVLVKRKKILLGVFFVPVILAIIIALIIPRYYRGESEISIPAYASNIPSGITASNIVRLIGNINDTKKNKIFANNSGAIKSVIISIPKKAPDKVNIIIDAKTADIIPQSFNNLFDYVNNLPEIKAAVENIQAEADLKTEKHIEETDFKINKLREVKKANLIFLNHITEQMKKKRINSINVINPANLIDKDLNVSLEIKRLEREKSDAMKLKKLAMKVSVGILGPPSVTKQPSNEKVKQSIIITVIISLMSAMFIVFFLDYIERMKMRNNK